jgi:hypothetical protein
MTAFSGADAVAFLSDTAHFTIAGATASTVTPIGVKFHLDGSMITGIAIQGFGDLGIVFGFGGARVTERFLLNSSTGFVATLASGSGASGWTSATYASETPSLVEFTGTFDVTGPTADIPISLFADLQCLTGALCDYRNTGSFSFDLPAGVRFTSDSNVLLTTP